MKKWSSESNYPPGGWVYRLPGDGVTLLDPSRSALARKVAEVLKCDTDEADRLVVEQMCATFPQFCKDPKGGPSRKAATPDRPPRGARDPFYRDVAASLVNALETPLSERTTDAQLGYRLRVCDTCPAARDVAEFGCSTCVSTILEARRALTAGRPTLTAGAKVCSAYRADCVALALHPPKSEPRVGWPATCWAPVSGIDPNSTQPGALE